jgi:hypothetical protein
LEAFMIPVPMSKHRVFALGLLAASALAGSALPARAQATAEQAKVLEQQIRGWFADLAWPGADVAALPLRITPAGDAYRVEYGPGGLTGVTVSGGPVTATAKPLDGGRWALDNIQIPSPYTVSIQKMADATAAGLPTGFTMTVGSQDMRAVFDPTLATTSSLDGKMTDVANTVTGPKGDQATKIAAVTWHSSWQPKDGTRQTVSSEVTMEGYSSIQPTKQGGPVSIAIDRVRASSRAEQADFARFGQMVRAVMTLVDSAQKQKADKAHAAKEPTPAQRETMRAAVNAAASLFASADMEETLEGVRVQAAGHGGRVDKVVLGGGMGAPGGKAELRLKLALTGLDSPEVPGGAWRDLLPRHVGLSPRVSGIAKDELVSFALKAIDKAGTKDAAAEMQAEALGLLADGPLTLGLDDIVLDLGVAKLTGAGTMEVTSPDEISGAAELRATGLDALIQRLGRTPELKTAVPVLIFLKGIGKQDGKEMIWKLAYEDGKVMVNGTDLSAIMPGK